MPRTIKILSGDNPRTVSVGDKEPAAPGGTNEEGKQETVDEAVERMSGSGQGQRQNQSTDRQNQY